MFELPPLPYAMDALAPHLTQETLEYHYGKHHQTYVTNLNNLIKDSPYASLTLEEIIQDTSQKPDKVGIFNNAAQIWNHTFYWNSMKPNGGGKPTGKILEKIESDFGNYEAFRDTFKQAATTQFGSGWAWLVQGQDGKLKVVKTGNADLPLVHGERAILTCDVWEHAYYIDFRNRRPDYVDVFLNHLVNWDFAEANLGK
ncbi:Superoxide dismutase [Candidatus Bealeia paramacronuclearis]|uniref:Superoxide dismutase n=2 Tax=Candidatus Bealeia paramacronuclearis TaxID=1921001 RepID=A0ABZ2C3V1_9PROT|nr:Superoxide dismutase [Candidatus Bealeia paramacronuclearis]